MSCGREVCGLELCDETLESRVELERQQQVEHLHRPAAQHPRSTQTAPRTLTDRQIGTRGSKSLRRRRYESDKVSPRRRRDDMPPSADSSSIQKISAELRLSADRSAVRTSLVAGGG